MATVPDPRGELEDFGVLLGWSHARTSRGIQLKVQSTAPERREGREITARNYLMTKNQALILAKYLLDVTGQSLPVRAPEGRLARLFRRLTGG